MKKGTEINRRQFISGSAATAEIFRTDTGQKASGKSNGVVGFRV